MLYDVDGHLSFWAHFWNRISESFISMTIAIFTGDQHCMEVVCECVVPAVERILVCTIPAVVFPVPPPESNPKMKTFTLQTNIT